MWELDPAEAVADRFESFKVAGHEIPSFKLRHGQVIIDLREAKHFEINHLPGAINIQLESLNAMSGSPFYDADLLSRQWNELNDLFKPGSEQMSALKNITLPEAAEVLVVCYDGDTSRMASSILRNRKVNASSCRGGMARFESWLQKHPQQSNGRGSFQPILNMTKIEAIRTGTPATPAG
jgi:rhodanese-related sulfurtransferase